MVFNGLSWISLMTLTLLMTLHALLSHTHRQMQDKTSTLERVASSIGLRINKQKTKVMRINANNIKTIVLQGCELEEVKEFTNLESVMDRSGGTDK